jgi:tetratricopeptide (TPR) repeat protein
MYVKTPKRYRGAVRRSPFSCGRYLLWLLMILFITIGVGIYQNRQLLQPRVDRVAATMISNLDAQMATMNAPTPRPTIDPATNLITGNNAWERGDITSALIAYEEIMPSLPNDVTVHQRATMGMLTRGKASDALDYAANTVTADPFDSDAWATQAFALAWEEQYTAAIASAYQALDITPDNGRALAFLAYAYWGNGQGELANSRASEALRVAPERWEGYWVRGLIRENTRFDFEGALADYQAAYDYALEQNPAMAGITATGIARIYLSYDVPAAINILEEARAIDPDNTLVLYWLGRVQFQYRGDYGQAQTPLADCVRVNPVDTDCQYYLGRTLDRLGDQASALQAFTTAIDNGTQSARTYWWAANMHVALGSCSDATPYLETGYRMVLPGDLPAVDEGVTELEDAYDALLSTCRIAIVPSNNNDATATPAPTNTPAPAVDSGR